MQDGGIEGVGTFGLRLLDCLLHFDEQADHLACPPLVPHDGDGFELTEVVGIMRKLARDFIPQLPLVVVEGQLHELGLCK